MINSWNIIVGLFFAGIFAAGGATTYFVLKHTVIKPLEDRNLTLINEKSKLNVQLFKMKRAAGKTSLEILRERE